MTIDESKLCRRPTLLISPGARPWAATLPPAPQGNVALIRLTHGLINRAVMVSDRPTDIADTICVAGWLIGWLAG